MLTKTLPLPEQIETPSTTSEIQKEIKEKVDERGFYLYEWISPEELRTSVKSDYLSIVRWASIPLAIFTLIAGLFWLAGGLFSVILSILGVLSVFYLIVFIILVAKMFHKSYLYTRGADVVITDDHYVSGGKVLRKDDFEWQKQAFRVMETLFREPLFKKSKLDDYVEMQKKWLLEQLKTIAWGGGEIIQNVGRSRDSGPIIMVILLAGALYSGMMGFVYFVWVFFVSILAQVFSWFANKALLATHNTEHTIQALFHDIYEASVGLKAEKKESISLLTEAGQNAWVDNLSGKLNSSFEELNDMARLATDNSIDLRKELENSKYKDIFNFKKYDNWIKTQVLAPIEEILELLEKNRAVVAREIESIEAGAKKKITDNMWWSTGNRALEVQKERFQMQIESFDRMITMMQSYKQKLQ